MKWIKGKNGQEISRGEDEKKKKKTESQSWLFIYLQLNFFLKGFEADIWVFRKLDFKENALKEIHKINKKINSSKEVKRKWTKESET